MAEQTNATNPLGIEGLPILPTGSGVADLEIVREQAAVAVDDVADRDTDLVPTEDGSAADESEAQPS